MAYTQASNKAVQKYSKKAYDTTVMNAGIILQSRWQQKKC